MPGSTIRTLDLQSSGTARYGTTTGESAAAEAEISLLGPTSTLATGYRQPHFDE